MSDPKRIQRKRTKGWRMPEGAVYVGRPTVFGNPFRPVLSDCCPNWDVEDDNGVRYLIDHSLAHDYGMPRTSREYAVSESVRLFADDLTYWLGGRLSHDPSLASAVSDLAGHDLACWCPLAQPCHADVLLEIANTPRPPSGERRCHHPGLDHDDRWSYCWPCPGCGVCKFIGHGPLCGDCHPTTTERPAAEAVGESE